MRAAPAPATRVGARMGAGVFGAVTGMTGLLPPRLRYGYVHRFTRVLLSRPLRSLSAAGSGSTAATRSIATATATATARDVSADDLTCVLGAGELDIGGIGSVVELLATSLPAWGVTPTVVCLDDAARARRLRAAGIAVRTVTDEASAQRAFREIHPDVIQLHGAPAFLEAAARAARAPVVPVLHNTEIHYSPAQWRRFSLLLSESASAVAVSELVRTFHARHLPSRLRSRIAVIPNAAPGLQQPGTQQSGTQQSGTEQRRRAREVLQHVVGGRFGNDVVFVCLARYDAQKNIAGTVASFLACVAAGVPAQLVIAGEPSDWVEFERSEALRRASRDSDRVHLLSTSDAGTLLAAADAFLLNSFFEGWPVAATEAWAAGLPLILSDVGGARELVARDPERSVLIDNAVGDAQAVTDARVERARWNAGHQRNSRELGDAIRQVVGTVQRERDRPPAARNAHDGVVAMIDAHARMLRNAASATAAEVRPDRAGPWLTTDEGRSEHE